MSLVPGVGIDFARAAEVLSELHPSLLYTGGAIEDPDQIRCLKDPWVARVKTLSGRYHALIVDAISNGVVAVRDPWGLAGPGSGEGTEATIRLDEFLERWNRGYNGIIVPDQLKLVNVS